MELRIGTKGTCTKLVEEADTAIARGSGTLRVFATPALAELMEKTAWQSIDDQLEEGFTTVGTDLELRHLAPTPVGATVTCTSELVEQDRKSLTFQLEASDETGVVGKALHKRFIVAAQPFQEKAEARRA